jgi:alkanesulfonate monooxygenase SsuD/methylene tetrahydromethanopterin reductase-like flavin-dependent oxidoreductase (luciferase family)
LTPSPPHASTPVPASTSVLSFGLGVPNGGDFADPHALAELARAAEAAGWDGVFLWDHVIRRPPWAPMVDPWIALSAMAVATDRVLLGPMVTPLARRRVSNVARQTVTLDLLSGGRLRLGVGLGAPDDEFTRFGEAADPRRRARKLDESIDVLRRLWTGEDVEYRGEDVVADGVRFLPTPVHGRIPIWVAGKWPGGAPFRRAARHDGVWPVPASGRLLDVDSFGDCVAAVRRFRAELGRHDGFDACFMTRSSAPDDADARRTAERLAEVGGTWWIESLDDPTVPFAAHVERVVAGPLRRPAAGA